MRLDWWQSVEALLAQGERVFLCFVVEATKGSPGTPGAAIAASLKTKPLGTIGGGRMELDLLKEAALALEDASYRPRCETLHHHAVSGGRASGLICGGSQTHLSLILEPDRDRSTVAEISQALAAERGDVLRISPEGLRCLSGPADTHRKLERTNADWSYQERLTNPYRIAILGGGHCGVALAGLMRGLGYTVNVFETRADLFTFTELPSSEAFVVANFADAGALIAQPERTFTVVMTAAYPTDVDALAGLLQGPFPFIGLMGTRLKIARIRTALTERGFAPKDIDKVTAPVGLPMDSDTPEEIAVSIAAQILLIRTDLNLK